jgi:hypothetical protein
MLGGWSIASLNGWEFRKRIIITRVISSTKLVSLRSTFLPTAVEPQYQYVKFDYGTLSLFTMPMTRSASNAKKSSSSRVDANLKKKSGRPTSKSRRLEEEINRSHNEAEVSVQPRPVKSRGKGDSLLHGKVKELELEVRRLKKVTRFPSTTTDVVLTGLGIRLVLWIARR